MRELETIEFKYLLAFVVALGSSNKNSMAKHVKMNTCHRKNRRTLTIGLSCFVYFLCV